MRTHCIFQGHRNHNNNNYRSLIALSLTLALHHPLIETNKQNYWSLIALSLIMALLQSKPAPMYILDEIDAALDLFHTQHIGTLFCTRFRSAQFIVVSLKEGLFINSNVLFRTLFRDGTSVVECAALVW